MAYRDSKIGLMARSNPEEAKVLLRAVYQKQGASASLAAKFLGVSRRTFDRIVRALRLDGEFAKVRKLRRAA